MFCNMTPLRGLGGSEVLKGLRKGQRQLWGERKWSRGEYFVFGEMCATVPLRVQGPEPCKEGGARLPALPTNQDQLWETGLYIFCLFSESRETPPEEGYCPGSSPNPGRKALR